MKIEQSSITFEPRTVANCLDMSMKFIGVHLRDLLVLWAAIAVPTCALVYATSRWLLWDLRLAAAIAFLAAYPLGVCLSQYSLPVMFGKPFSLCIASADVRRTSSALLGKGVVLRLVELVGLGLCVIPGALLMFRTGFLIEQAWFSGEQSERDINRANRLVRESGSDLAMRGCSIVLFCALIAVVMFFLVDYTTNLLFGFPIFVGRIAESLPIGEGIAGSGFDVMAVLSDMSYLAWSDPRILTTLTGVLLLVYPIGRLAWFFCYIDVQVRKDLWDVQREMTRHASRLERET